VENVWILYLKDNWVLRNIDITALEVNWQIMIQYDIMISLPDIYKNPTINGCQNLK
jgi:hypothetical protein